MIGPRGMRACLVLAVAGAWGLASCTPAPEKTPEAQERAHAPDAFPVPEYSEVNDIVDALADGDAAALAAHFSDTLEQESTPEELLEEWAELTTRYGAFLGIDNVQGRTIETSHFGELTTVIVNCRFAIADTTVGVVLNADKELFSLAIPRDYDT